MVIGIRDSLKLVGITIVSCCAVFVCFLFLNYNIDLAGIKDEVATYQAMVFYDAQVATAKVTAGVSGGCLVLTAIILLIFYIKNYIDTHGKELGILKALGYSCFQIAAHFWVFGISVLLGALAGYLFASAYMPTFYRIQNKDGFLPQMAPQFHMILIVLLIIVPTVFFMLLAVMYAFFKMKSPVLNLLKEIKNIRVRHGKSAKKEVSFLTGLRKGTLRSRKTLIFFVCFSAFCFSAMTQMSWAMVSLASEDFSIIMISIGLILAFTTLFMSLTSIINANTKTIAMMKVFGYSPKECRQAILDGYRPVSYIGFAIGTAYQYLLLRITVDIVFADFDNIPVYKFDYKAFAICFAAFVVIYELIMYWYSLKLNRQSVKSIMLE